MAKFSCMQNSDGHKKQLAISCTQYNDCSVMNLEHVLRKVFNRNLYAIQK